MPNPLPPNLSALEARLGIPSGTLDAEDTARAGAALEDATTLILAEVPASVASAWESDAPKVAVLIALKAARREFENPRGLQTEAMGDHSIGLTDTSGVYLTAREIAQIHRVATGRRGGFVGSVRTPSAYYDEREDTA